MTTMTTTSDLCAEGFHDECAGHVRIELLDSVLVCDYYQCHEMTMRKRRKRKGRLGTRLLVVEANSAKRAGRGVVYDTRPENHQGAQTYIG
jgi:hypothetical protein